MEPYQPDALPLIDLAVLLSPLTTTINKNICGSQNSFYDSQNILWHARELQQ